MRRQAIRKQVNMTATISMGYFAYFAIYFCQCLCCCISKRWFRKKGSCYRRQLIKYRKLEKADKMLNGALELREFIKMRRISHLISKVWLNHRQR